MPIPLLSFSTESAKELLIYDFLFLVAIYSPNNDNKHSSEIRNEHHNSHFTVIEVFLSWRCTLTTGLK